MLVTRRVATCQHQPLVLCHSLILGMCVTGSASAESAIRAGQRQHWQSQWHPNS